MGAQGCQQAPRPAPEPPISPAGAHGVAGGAGVGWGGRPLATVPSRGSPLCVPPLCCDTLLGVSFRMDPRPRRFGVK